MDCPLQHEVSDNRTDGARGGTGCMWTGGHCLPGDYCEARQKSYEASEGERLRLERREIEQ